MKGRNLPAFLAAAGAVLALAVATGGAVAGERQSREHATGPLPDWYPYVASDILKWAQPAAGVWVDLGAGTGGVGLAVATAEHEAAAASAIVLLDPDTRALSQALSRGREQGLENRLVAVEGVAEKMPLLDNSVDLVFSRGSIWFWQDPVEGLREVYRVLRPGGKAMIGGGLGDDYPEWARREFMRRRRGSREADSPQAKEFARRRHPDTMRQWAKDAGLTEFEVTGRGALPADDPRTGSGNWLRFTKQELQ